MTILQAVRRRACKPKVRTGCDTCKRRRVKCDEAKPQCNRCLHLGTACNYSFRSEQPPEAISKPVFILPALGPPNTNPKPRLYSSPSSILTRLTTQDGMYLEYFVRKLSGQFSPLRLGDSAMSNFWSSAILQQGHHDEYVLEAILGIGALAWARKSTQARVPLCHHRLSGALRNPHYQSALLHYNSAIQKLRPVVASAQPEAQLQLMYMSCLLFLMFELLQENHKAVDQLGSIGMGCYSRLSPSARPSYVRSANSVTGFMASSNIVYVSLSPQSPSIRAAIFPDVSVALQPPAVVGPESSIQGFIAVWWRLLTTVINLCVLTATQKLGQGGSGTAAKLNAVLTLIGSWEKETRRRLAATQEADSINLLQLVVTITSRFALVVQQHEWVNRTPETRNVGPIPMDALEYAAIIELFKLCQTWPAGTAGLLCAEDEFDVTNEAVHSPALPALVHIARQCPSNATRLEALELLRSLLHPKSATNLKALYMVLRALADLERWGLPNHYEWTESAWNDACTTLHVTLTPVRRVGNRRTLSRQLVLRVEDYGL